MRKAACINTDGDVSRKHGARGSRPANLFAFTAKTSQWRLLKFFANSMNSVATRELTVLNEGRDMLISGCGRTEKQKG